MSDGMALAERVARVAQKVRDRGIRLGPALTEREVSTSSNVTRSRCQRSTACSCCRSAMGVLARPIMGCPLWANANITCQATRREFGRDFRMCASRFRSPGHGFGRTGGRESIEDVFEHFNESEMNKLDKQLPKEFWADDALQEWVQRHRQDFESVDRIKN